MRFGLESTEDGRPAPLLALLDHDLSGFAQQGGRIGGHFLRDGPGNPAHVSAPILWRATSAVATTTSERFTEDGDSST